MQSSGSSRGEFQGATELPFKPDSLLRLGLIEGQYTTRVRFNVYDHHHSKRLLFETVQPGFESKAA